MSLNFTKLSEVNSKNDTQEKVPTIVGKDYFLEKLTPTQFEELIYYVYKNEMSFGAWKDKFDDISLLAGTRDRGRDCALFKNGYCTGIIQCKHSENLSEKYAKSELVREIIKYILHAFLDNSLIPNSNTFTYYIAVSGGFSSEALTLLEDFNSSVLKEAKLKTWCESVIKNNNAFKTISYDSAETYLKVVLSKIKIIKIFSKDIQLLLAAENNAAIVTKYFEVKSVIDKVLLDEWGQKIMEDFQNKSSFKETSNIPIPVLLEEFRKASFNLSIQKNEFENVPESHIDRTETVELLDWIKTPIRQLKGENNISLLIGNAGCGKTAILKDLYEALNKDNIPVIGIKSDRYYVSTIKQLEERLDLKESIEKIILTLKQEYEQVIVIVDQLDALSQTLSGKREYLDTFNYLINELKAIDRVRIIISVRTYDLNYDPDLQNYKHHKTIKVRPLTAKEVEGVLGKLGISYSSLSIQLKNLLEVPNNLNVLCKVFNTSTNLQSIRTLHDLYDHLWSQKILDQKYHNTDARRVKEFLFKLASAMNSQQVIALSSSAFVDSFFNEINYLSSAQLILKESNQLQFFHQTFYDYVFAKQFVESGESVEEFIVKNKNGLFIRSSLKMIISFLSKDNHKRYLSAFSNILLGKEYKFHIKFLFINLLGYEEHPSLAEKEFVQTKIFTKAKFKELFIESINSKEWLTFLIEKKVIFNLIVKNPTQGTLNLAWHLLVRHFPSERKEILDFLNSLPKNDDNEKFISRLLYFVKIWDQPLAIKFFDSVYVEKRECTFEYYKILEDAVASDPSWVISILHGLFTRRITKTNNKRERKSDNDHYENLILDLLFEKARIETLHFCLDLFKLRIDKYKPEGEIKKSYHDNPFMFFDYNKAERTHGDEHLLFMIIHTLEDIAKERPSEFRKLFKQHESTFSKTLQLAFMYGLTQNPQEFKNEIFELIVRVSARDGFEINDKIDFQIRQLIKVAFNYFTNSQKEDLKTIILSINPFDENTVYKSKESVYMPGKRYGKTKLYYLECLPHDEIFNDVRLKKIYQELKRKFPTPINDREPRSGSIRGIPAPLSKKSYEAIPFEGWIATFQKYNDDYVLDRFLDTGGQDEHARKFKEEVQKRPDHFYPFILRLCSEKISNIYLFDGLNGLKEAGYAPLKVMLPFKEIIKKPLSASETRRVIFLTDYFIQHKVVDQEILDFLCHVAIRHEDPENDEKAVGRIYGNQESESRDHLQHGINTVRGAAVSNLVQINFNPAFSQQIFATLTKVCDDRSLSVRVSMLHQLALLMNLDRQKTLDIFLLAIKNNEEEIAKHSLWTARYLLNYYFEELRSYFENIIKHESIHEDLSVVLAIAWLKNKESSYELLQRVLELSEKAKAKMVDVAQSNMICKNKLNQKSVDLFCMFLDNESDQIAEEYGNTFLHFKPENFELLFPVFKKYANSKVGFTHVHYFYDYLMKCLKKHPIECLELISNFKKHEKPDRSQGYSADDRIKVVVGIYNSLRELHTHDNNNFEKTLKIFDYMLQEPSYRMDAYRVIQEVEL